MGLSSFGVGTTGLPRAVGEASLAEVALNRHDLDNALIREDRRMRFSNASRHQEKSDPDLAVQCLPQRPL